MKGVLALLAAVTIWGSTFVIIKAVLASVGPFSITVIRFLIALALLAPFAYRAGYRAALSFRPTFLAFGLTGIALYFGLQNLGLVFTSAGNAALIQAGIPAVTAGLSVIWLKEERLTALQWVGIVLAVMGTLLVVGLGKLSSSETYAMVGNLLILGSVGAWAVYTIQGRRLVSQYPTVVSMMASIGAGTLFILPFAATEMWFTGRPKFTVQSVSALLYLGAIASTLPLFLWNYALRFVPASVAAPYINLVPLVGVAMAAMMGETITWQQLVGGALALLGVWLSTTAYE